MEAFDLDPKPIGLKRKVSLSKVSTSAGRRKVTHMDRQGDVNLACDIGRRERRRLPHALRLKVSKAKLSQEQLEVATTGSSSAGPMERR